MDNELLATKLKELRKARNYTQMDVAAALGIVRQTYSHYETGIRTPDSEILYKLASFYEIDVNDLMQLVAPLDEGTFPHASQPSSSVNHLAEFLEYTSNPYNEKKLHRLSAPEKELLFYFEKLDTDAQREIIEFTKIKSYRKR